MTLHKVRDAIRATERKMEDEQRCVEALEAEMLPTQLGRPMENIVDDWRASKQRIFDIKKQLGELRQKEHDIQEREEKKLTQNAEGTIEQQIREVEADFGRMMLAADATAAGRFAGLASAYNVVITGVPGMPTVIAPGAFAAAVRDHSRVRLLRDHQQGQVVGTVARLEERPQGLWVEATLARTPLGEEVAELVRSKALRELSVGYTAKVATTEKRAGVGMVRVIREADLIDISVCTWGANPGARIAEAASRDLAGMEVAGFDWRADVAQAERELRLLSGEPEGRRAVARSRAPFSLVLGRELTGEEVRQRESAERLRQDNERFFGEPWIRAARNARPR
jgi:HK97 family phage prohead protease